MPDHTSHPSPAAMRAATQILWGKGLRESMGEMTGEQIARIIDRETGCAELRDALVDISLRLNAMGGPTKHEIKEAAVIASSILAKHGKEA